MSFWIRKYNIQLSQLPLGLVLSSVIVVVICATILATILLLLPIQDKIRGDVQIYASGQPLSVNAPTDGFLRLYRTEGASIEEGQLLASIDVRVQEKEIEQLEQLIFSGFNKEGFQYESELGALVEMLPLNEFRQIKNELFKLQDLLQQYNLHRLTADPKEIIKAIDNAISVNRDQAKSFVDIDRGLNELIDLFESQLQNDSTLLSYGAISERELQESYKTLIESKSQLIESHLRKQEIARATADDERSKINLKNEYRTRLIELRESILDQEGIIRKEYQNFKEKYMIFAPVSGTLNMPHETVANEMVQQGELVVLLSKMEEEEKTISEMFVSGLNIGKIKPGMKVRVGIEQYDQKEFGIYYTLVEGINYIPQNGKYKVTLHCQLPLNTSYGIDLPLQKSYSGKGEILLGKINLLTKIVREIHFNRDRYGSTEE